MQKYRVRWDYEARDWHGNLIRLHKDEVIEMDEAVATWVLADSPGVLHEINEAAQPRLIEEPGNDRMMRKGQKR